MYEEFFSRRLAQLRAQKGVSAREMSLAIGQNSSYINRIENQRAFPSMQGFFYICEYLGVTPGAFFADPDAGGAEGVAGKFARLPPARQALVEALMDQLANPRNRRKPPPDAPRPGVVCSRVRIMTGR